MVQLPVRSVSWLVLLSCSTSCPWVVTSTTLFVLASCLFIASSNLAHSILLSLDPLSLLQLTFGDWLLWGFLLGTGLRVADFPNGIFQFWHFPVWASCNLRVFWVMNKYGQWFTLRWWNSSCKMKVMGASFSWSYTLEQLRILPVQFQESQATQQGFLFLKVSEFQGHLIRPLVGLATDLLALQTHWH